MAAFITWVEEHVRLSEYLLTPLEIIHGQIRLLLILLPDHLAASTGSCLLGNSTYLPRVGR